MRRGASAAGKDATMHAFGHQYWRPRHIARLRRNLYERGDHDAMALLSLLDSARERGDTAETLHDLAELPPREGQDPEFYRLHRLLREWVERQARVDADMAEYSAEYLH
jgi:hypothetical protein